MTQPTWLKTFVDLSNARESEMHSDSLPPNQALVRLIREQHIPVLQQSRRLQRCLGTAYQSQPSGAVAFAAAGLRNTLRARSGQLVFPWPK
jgi:hypothetical protein